MSEPRVLGSGRCLKVSAVIDLFRDLSRSVEQADTFMEYHNRYTLYSLVLLGFGTGVRAVGNAFPSPDDCDAEGGLMVLADKRVQAFDRVRVVPLVPVVDRQIAYFLEHLDAVTPQIAKGSLSRLPDHLLRPFFLYKSRRSRLVYAVKPAIPKMIIRHLGDFCVPIDNAHRHFLSSELRERGLPSHYVNAFMGHWGIGGGPFHYYSTLQVKEYLQKTGSEIECLLKDVGAFSMRSRYVFGGR